MSADITFISVLVAALVPGPVMTSLKSCSDCTPTREMSASSSHCVAAHAVKLLVGCCHNIQSLVEVTRHVVDVCRQHTTLGLAKADCFLIPKPMKMSMTALQEWLPVLLPTSTIQPCRAILHSLV